MVIAGCSYVFAFLTTPFVPSLNYMFFTYSIPFVITMSFVAQLTIRTQKDYFDKHYGKAMGVRFSGVSLGVIVMSYILPIIYDQLAFKGTLLALLGFSPLFVIFALVSRTSPDRTINQSSGQGFLSNKINIYRELLQDNSFVLCFSGTTTFFLICFADMIFMVNNYSSISKKINKHTLTAMKSAFSDFMLYGLICIYLFVVMLITYTVLKPELLEFIFFSSSTGPLLRFAESYGARGKGIWEGPYN